MATQGANVRIKEFIQQGRNQDAWHEWELVNRVCGEIAMRVLGRLSLTAGLDDLMIEGDPEWANLGRAGEMYHEALTMMALCAKEMMNHPDWASKR